MLRLALEIPDAVQRAVAHAHRAVQLEAHPPRGQGIARAGGFLQGPHEADAGRVAEELDLHALDAILHGPHLGGVVIDLLRRGLALRRAQDHWRGAAPFGQEHHLALDRPRPADVTSEVPADDPDERILAQLGDGRTARQSLKLLGILLHRVRPHEETMPFRAAEVLPAVDAAVVLAVRPVQLDADPGAVVDPEGRLADEPDAAL
mmetsp:Transcript_64452/g.197168  ORF Transcript_64452/g.197168 Transcript_64452/m.197168 type:complete len:205 (+) Transcript_64452:344-958(+)